MQEGTMSPRFDYVDESGIELRWDGKGPFETGIRSRTSGEFLYVDSFDGAYAQPPTQENFLRLCESFMRVGNRNSPQRRLWPTNQAVSSRLTASSR
jgi:hypothetical protein